MQNLSVTSREYTRRRQVDVSLRVCDVPSISIIMVLLILFPRVFFDITIIQLQ